MIAIQTKFISPTNTRGARIKAWTASGFSATIAYPYSSGNEASHFEAVKELVNKNKLDWDLSGMTYGGTENGYVFCFPHSIVQEIPKEMV